MWPRTGPDLPLPEGLTAGSEAAIQKAVHSLQDDLTPRQLQRILPRVVALGGAAAKAVRNVLFLAELGRERAQKFELSRLSRDVRLFSDPAIPASRKALLVVFAGSSNMAMMPSAMLLQHLPSSLFDVVLLCDRSNLSYESGVDGFDGPLAHTMSALAARLGASRYRAVFCYGTSMGGFPALRAGLFLDACRAVAIGGSFAWSVRRLLDGRRFTPAYDPLCVCTDTTGTELVVAYSAKHHRDPEQAVRLAARVTARQITRRLSTHNLPYALQLEGSLGAFFSTLFDFDPGLLHRPLPLARLRRAARRAFRLIRRPRTPN